MAMYDGTRDGDYRDAFAVGEQDQQNNYRGWDGDDTLIGGRLTDFLNGEKDDDLLIGGEGMDVLDGDEGNDTLYGGEGSDDLRGEGGFNTIYGENGSDSVNVSSFSGVFFDGGQGFDSISFNDGDGGIRINMATGVNGGAAEGDVLISVERIVATPSADILIGDGASNNLLGNGGDDTIAGGAGADALEGGAGFDYLNYADSDAGVTIGLTRGIQGVGGHAASDQFIEFEGVIGSAFNDVLIGDAGANRLLGGDGVDALYGGLGQDALYGGAGIDYARYDDANYGDLTISLASPGQNAGAAAAGDSYSGVEGIIGGVGADRIGGNGLVNYLYGGAGNDTLAGNGGNDLLVGGAGSDVFVFTEAPTGAAIDRIRDFSVANDTISLQKAAFTTLFQSGVLNAGAFHIGSGAADAGDRIIYNSGTGALLYDRDGTGAAAALQFAQLNAGLALTNNDFVVG